MSVDLEFPAGPNSPDDKYRLTCAVRGDRLLIEFVSKEVPTESQVESYHQQVLAFIHKHGCRNLTFDLDGIKLLPSRMLGFLVGLKHDGHDVELINVHPFIEDIFRVTRLETVLKVRGTPPTA